MLDSKALAAATGAVVREIVAPLVARIVELETRQGEQPSMDLIRGMVGEAVAKIEIPEPRHGKDGKSVEPAAVKAMVDEAVAALPAPRDGTSVTVEDLAPAVRSAVDAAVAALPRPADGKSVTVDDVAPLIQAQVATAVAALPLPQDGKSVTVEEVEPVIRSEVERVIAALPAPKDGASVTIDDVAPLIRGAVDEAVRALPAPKDGESVTVQDVEPLIAAAVEKAVKAIPPAKDGVGLAGALIDRTGSLIVTLSDGRTCELGRVDGAPGLDGLGFDDLTVEHDGERGFEIRFARGEQAKSFAFSLPVLIDRGVYREGQKYAAGDAVTFGGSLWIAQKETEAKPDGPDTGWRLGVKRGRDGRDAQAR